MKQVFTRPYIYWVFGIFLVYMTLNVLISQFYITVQYIPYYLTTIKWTELLLGTILSVTIGILVAINMVYSYIRYKERKIVKKSGAITCLGTVAGLATGVCSACVAGVVPLLFSFAGVSFSWGVLPFKGIEIQVLTVALLSISLLWLNKRK